MLKITSKEIPHSFRNKYLRSSGSVYISTGGGGNNSNGSSVDLSDVAKLSGYNVFTGNNTFKGGIAIDNPYSELSIQSNSVGVASLRYSNACFELKNIKSNKSLQLHDDERFEFDGNKILTVKNFEDELNTVYVTLKTAQTITGEKTFDASITLTENSRICSEGNLLHYKDGTSHAIWDASNSNLNTVDWEAKNIITMAVRTSKDGNAILQYINGNINVGYSQGCTFILGDSDVLHQKTGVNYVVWDASNSNLKTVDWTAKDLSANKNIQTLNFASGWAGAGCRIDNNGKAECSDLFVRGSLNVYELVINQIRGTNGAIAVSDVAELEEDTSTSGDRWYCEHLKGQGIANWISPFKVGDIVKCQRWNGKTVVNWISEVTNADNSNFMIAKNFRGIAIPQPKKGDVVIRWNSSDANRKGLLYLTSSDSNAPYMDVMHDEKTRVRLGRLDGISGLSGYGIVGRDNSLNNIFYISSNGTAGIAGWTFDNAKFKGGNLELVASGIIRHTGGKYSLNNDGSGQLANGNISWDAAGKVTFGNSVSLQWTNGISAAQNTATTANNTATSANNTANNANTQALNANELALAMAFGKMLYRDPTFYNGNNGIELYNNSSNGTVTILRITDNNAPNDSKAVLQIQNTGTASPNCGGFHWGTPTSYKKVFITRIIAKIPTGRDISYHSNSIGSGGTQKWLTSTSGTGEWKEYVCKVSCGTSSFSSTHFFAITGNVGSSSSPLRWYLAYATVFDVTSTEKYTTTIDANGIYTGTLTAGQVNAVAINAGSITTGTLNAGRIASRSITADKIQAGSLTATEINVSSLFSNMITTNNITITSGGRIGNFVITSDGSLNNEYGYGSIYLRNNFKQTSLSPGFLSIQCTSGGHALFINRADQQGGDVTIMGRYGVFDFSSLDIKGNNNLIRGLCFNARTTAYTTTLTNEDVWLTCTNSGTITVTLPSSPPTGKVLFIKKLTGSRVALSSSKPMVSVSTFNSINLDSAGYVTVLVFDGTRWSFSQIPP